MENFVVSARKYRPNTFESVVGQQSITETLKNAIKSNQLAQAFLFTGPRGVGKTTCARILAKTINCKNLNENIEPCNVCDSCKAFNNSASFNVHELDAASNNSVDDIRSLVEKVRIPPQAVQYKVYIIDEVHMLSQAAFNAFLKTLEEPPAYAKFILATTEKHKIIPTILSRCQTYDFNRIKVEDIENHLANVAEKEEIKADRDALFVIAQKADGSLRDALSIFDQIATYSGNNITYQKTIENLNVVDVNTYFSLTDTILSKEIHELLLQLNEIIDSGHELNHFILGLGDHFRNLLICKDEITVKLLDTTTSTREKYINQARNCHTPFILQALDIISKCDLNFRNAGNKRLLVELSLIQITGLLTEVIKKVPSEKESKIENILPTVPTPKTDNITNTKIQEKPKEEKPIVSGSSISITPVEEKKYVSDDKENKLVVEDSQKNDDFSEIMLNEAWSEYLDFLSKDNLDFKSFLSVANPQKIDKNAFQINVISDYHKQEFIKNKLAVISFLKAKLNVDTLDILVQVTKDEKPIINKPFTPKEKYENMASQNNAINHLRAKLNLELDF
ncbi:MAG: DNA polymerase III subunit gamma/tau [Bacteroidales bacterium]|nr:DNA polymerase III subunit gamma/tau [Bacteroidales bacterium]